MKKFLMTAVALASMSSFALAATGVAELSGVNGKVLVNQGEGFVAVSGVVSLAPGAQIMVGEDSAAVISYLGSDCKVSVASSSVATVSETAPCAAGEVVGLVDGVFIAPVAYLETINPAPAFAFLPLILGVTVAAGVGVLVLTDDNNDNGVSGNAD